MTTQQLKRTENELRSMTALCGFQLTKINKLKATIAKLERRIVDLEATVESYRLANNRYDVMV